MQHIAEGLFHFLHLLFQWLQVGSLLLFDFKSLLERLFLLLGVCQFFLLSTDVVMVRTITDCHTGHDNHERLGRPGPGTNIIRVEILEIVEGHACSSSSSAWGTTCLKRSVKLLTFSPCSVCV